MKIQSGARNTLATAQAAAPRTTPAFGALKRKHLGHQLAEHDVQERDRRERDDDG